MLNEASYLILSLKNEAEFLKLKSLKILLESYEKLIYSNTPHIVLKDMNIKECPYRNNGNFCQRLMNCSRFVRVYRDNVYMDITEDEAGLLIRNSSKNVRESRETNNITDLARRLGIITNTEAI